MKNVVIVSAVRTAIGNFNGSLSAISAVNLGAIVIKEVLNKVNINANLVDEVIMGNVLQAGLGQNPSRQAAVSAGVPNSVPGYSINKVCGSGLKSVVLACQAIKCDDADIVVAGGMENMSRSPYLVENLRTGTRMGDAKLIDSMLKDGLSDAFEKYHMGVTAENIAAQYSISASEQNTWSLTSQKRAVAALRKGIFESEIVAVTTKYKKDVVYFKTDEFPKKDMRLEMLNSLKPAFKIDGTVTAGNSSGINDGAAAVLLMSEDKAKELNLKPLVKIISYASFALDHKVMGLGPIGATKKALEKANLELKDIDLIEANEAFAVQFLAVGLVLGFDLNKVNINGGAIALGHPIGASGTRILVTLIHSLIREDKRYGLATLCIGGGQGIAMIVEKRKRQMKTT